MQNVKSGLGKLRQCALAASLTLAVTPGFASHVENLDLLPMSEQIAIHGYSIEARANWLSLGITAPVAQDAEVVADSEGQFDPETKQKFQLVQYITRKFKVSSSQALAVVQKAYQLSAETGGKVTATTILAVTAVESRFNPFATNGKAKGLMQVMVSAHPDEVREAGGQQRLFNIGTNLRLGTKILVSCVERVNGNVRLGLLHFNGSARDNGYADKVLREKTEMDAVAVADRDI